MRGKPPVAVSDDARKQCTASIKRYFAEQFDEDIGDLKADLILGYFLEEIGPTVYNQAVTDARAFFEERAADLEGVCYLAEFPYWTKR